jgi:hypothetical protein
LFLFSGINHFHESLHRSHVFVQFDHWLREMIAQENRSSTQRPAGLTGRLQYWANFVLQQVDQSRQLDNQQYQHKTHYQRHSGDHDDENIPDAFRVG